MSIPIPIHNAGFDIVITLFLWDLFPSTVANQFQLAIGGVVRALYISPYVLLLLLLIATNAWFFGWSTLTLAVRSNVLVGVGIGLLAGGVSIIAEWLIAKFLRRHLREFRLTRGTAQRAKSADLKRLGRSDVGRFRVSDVLACAVLEEYIYRYYLVSLALVLTRSFILAATVSCVAYGVIHEYFGIHSVVTKILSGAVYFVAAFLGGTLVAAMVGHVMLNSFVVLFAGSDI